MKNVLLFLGVLKLSAMMLAAESLQRDMDDNGVVWIYEKGAESIIRGIDRASTTCDVRRLSFPVELGGKPVLGIAAESFPEVNTMVSPKVLRVTVERLKRTPSLTTSKV